MILQLKHIVNNNKGVSLVGTALVVLISGLLIVPVYFTLMSATQMSVDRDPMVSIRYGLGEYYRVYGTLPCPAPLDAAIDDADYIRGDRASGSCNGVIDTNPGNLNGAYIGTIPAADLADAMDCLPEGFSGTGSRADFISNLPLDLQNVLKKDLWRVNDFLEDGSGNITADPANRARQNKLVEGKCLNADMIMDEHGHKILYAVSKYAVSLQHFQPEDPTHGTIRIFKPNLTDRFTEHGQWFVLASMGKDGKGAYNKQGAVLGPACGDPAAQFNNENCDNETDFVMGQYSLANNANYFDDKVDFSLDAALSEHSVWFWAATDDAQDNRDMRFMKDRRLVIDATSDAVIEVDDKLLIGEGDVSVKDSASTGEANVFVEGSTYGEKFCYDAGSSC